MSLPSRLAKAFRPNLLALRWGSSRTRRLAFGAAIRSYVLVFAMATGESASSAVHAADEGQEFLTIEQAPGAVFPDANRFERRDVPLTPELRSAIALRLGEVKPSLWEQTFVTFTARRDDVVLGYAVVVEEIGKHRPITSIVGVEPNGKVHDVAVMVYREAYGGDVSRRRFLEQYRGRAAPDRLAGQIRSIAGATLSVDALNRSVKKGIAVVDAVYLHPEVPR